MNLVFFETPDFTRQLCRYLDDEGFGRLQRALMEAPDLGAVMPGTGGFRKLRWRNEARNRGKRGGLRVIYYWLMQDRQIWLFAVYDKGEVADLTAAERRQLKGAIQRELEARRRSPWGRKKSAGSSMS